MRPRTLAFDRQSARSYDQDGRLHVSKSNISKANVCDYYGAELLAVDPTLDLDPNKPYRMWRAPEELEKAADSFRNLPILRRHVQVSAEDHKPDDVVGSIGSDVAYEHPYLTASQCIWDAQAIAAIEEDVASQYSPGYYFRPDMTAGVTPDGEEYDGVLRDIVGNHLALVEEGRTGPDVVVADEKPTPKEIAMKQTAFGGSLLKALKVVAPKIAMDAKLSQRIGASVKARFARAALTRDVLACDAEVTPEQLDEIIDAILGVEQEEQHATSPQVEDAEPEEHPAIKYLKDAGVAPEHVEKVRGMLPKPAEDEEGDPAARYEGGGMDEVQVEAGGQGDPRKAKVGAMDAKAIEHRLKAEFAAIDEAKEDVRDVVGRVIGMDSAAGIYRFALEQMGVDHSDIDDRSVKGAFRIAQDSAARSVKTTQRVQIDASAPGLERFLK